MDKPLYYPDPPVDPSCVLLAVPVELVPIVGALFARMEQRGRWATDADYAAGYAAFVELENQLMNSCIQDLIQEIRDFRGVKPESASVPVEDRTSDMYHSLNDVLTAFTDMRGILDDGWFSDHITTLADVVQAMRGTDKTNGAGMWDTMAGLLSAGASTASIVDFISDLLTSQEEIAVEGGLLLALITVSAANTGVLQQLALAQLSQSNSLTAIVDALRGSTDPTDNILQALRGNTAADATRNIAELLK